MKIKGGRKRFALFILIMWLLVLPFFITDESLDIFFKLFIIISNIAAWSIIIFLFIEKEEIKEKECGEKVRKYMENGNILFILLLVVIASIAITSFFDLLFPILFSGVIAISFFGAMLNNIFYPLEKIFSIWCFSKITSSIFIIFCIILFFLIGNVAIFFLFIS